MKFATLSVFILALAASAFAGTFVHPVTNLTAISGCAAQSLNLNPGWENVINDDGTIAIDPVTHLALQRPTWKLFMQWGSSTSVRVTYQWATLVKWHPYRKTACGVEYCPDPAVQNGPAGINLHWPLAYEVNGTTWTLTIAYWTNVPVKTDPSNTTMVPSRYHVEIWKWKVVRNTWNDLAEAVCFFYNLPAGVCERSVITSQGVVDMINWYVNGTPTPQAPYAPILGLKDLIAAHYNAQAVERFGEFESYIASLCGRGCAGDCPAPIPGVNEIMNTTDIPAANTLINIIWAIQQANGFTR